MPEPRERPVSLRPWQVRAALENQLSLLVVPMKPQPVFEQRYSYQRGKESVDYWSETRRWFWRQHDWSLDLEMAKRLPKLCPLGQPGDRLYGRETWRRGASNSVLYKVDEPVEGWFWRSSVVMPRWASRLHFEVEQVRVARVQEVSLGDAIAAGCGPDADSNPEHTNDLALEVLEHIWDATHPKLQWASNPWVWLVSVKTLEVAHAG